jgi:regulator of protease activity HflC (stomatin/prohibitin superfamily)
MSFFTTKTLDYNGREHNSPNIKRIVITAVVALFLLVTVLNSFSIIPTGYTGVKTTFGQINTGVVQQGFNFKIPYVQTIQKVNNKQQDIKFATEGRLWGETAEKVPVYMENITITYQINPEKSAWIYANVSDYTKNLVSSSIVSSAFKDAAVKFTAENVTTRANIEVAATQYLQQYLNDKYGENTVIVIKCSIANMDFEDSYNAAINARSLAQKEQETQKIANETSIAKAAAEAQVKLTQAQAEADALIISAEAQAEANEKLADSISDILINYESVQKWDGKLPSVMDSSALVGFNIGGLGE